MAQSFTTIPGNIGFVTGLANVATEIKLPNLGVRLTLFFVTNAGKLAFSGTDAMAISTPNVPIDADAFFSVGVRAGGRQGIGVSPGVESVFVTSATAATTVRAIIEPV